MQNSELLFDLGIFASSSPLFLILQVMYSIYCSLLCNLCSRQVQQHSDVHL